MAHDSKKTSSSPTDVRRATTQKKRCTARTKHNSKCRNWAMIGSDLCRIHQFKQGTETPKSPQASLPSVLPGVTETELHSRMKEQDKRIEEKKKRRKASEKKKKKKLELAAIKASNAIAQQADDTLINAGASPFPTRITSLRTMEDCLALIEASIDEILDLPPTLGKTRVMISAARTAGTLIIQAGVTNQAIEWFQENIKLVADIDLDRV